MIWSKLGQQPNLEEKLAFPWPRLGSVFNFVSFFYGVFLALASTELLQRNPHKIFRVVLVPFKASMSWYHELYAGGPVVWVVSVCAGLCICGTAKLITHAKRQEWMKTYVFFFGSIAGRGDYFADISARKATEMQHGQYPSSVKRLCGWAWVIGRISLCIWYGCMITRWTLRVEYLPAYGLPAYGTLYGQMYCSSKCMDATEWPAYGGGLQYRGRANDTVSTSFSLFDYSLAGWWQDLHTAARLNALAARLWHKGGLPGMHLGMEALLAAVSPERLVSLMERESAEKALHELQLYGHLFAPTWYKGRAYLTQRSNKEVWGQLYAYSTHPNAPVRDAYYPHPHAAEGKMRRPAADTTGSDTRSDAPVPIPSDDTAPGPLFHADGQGARHDVDNPLSGLEASSPSLRHPRKDRSKRVGSSGTKHPKVCVGAVGCIGSYACWDRLP